MGRPPPRHVAIIMDGNGRWAQHRGLPREQGHKAGARTVTEIVRTARALGLEVLTLYSFSTENWRRPRQEVDALMALLEEYVVTERNEMLDTGIRLHVIGQLQRLPGFVREVVEEVCAESDTGRTAMTLNLALSYGGRAELVEAVQAVARRVRAGQLEPGEIDEDIVSDHLYTAGMPDPDLLIRTSGESRVSNFLLWQLAYSEFYITDVFWPDFGTRDFVRALREFRQRDRRYGGIGRTPAET